MVAQRNAEIRQAARSRSIENKFKGTLGRKHVKVGSGTCLVEANLRRTGDVAVAAN